METNDLILTLGDFTGPLEVLWAEIREKRMDIMNLDLAELTQQYLLHIKNNFRELNVDRISDYLVMASYLVELKSAKVLSNGDEQKQLKNAETNEERFIRYLIEYKKYQEIMPLIEKLKNTRGYIFAKPEDDVQLYGRDEIPTADLPTHISPLRLLNAMRRVQNRLLTSDELVKTIVVQEIPVENVENQIYQILEQKSRSNQSCSFSELLQIIGLEKITLMYFVTAFIAILNLASKQKINIDAIGVNDFMLAINHHPITDYPQETTAQIQAREVEFAREVEIYAQKIKKQRYEKYLRKKEQYLKEKVDGESGIERKYKDDIEHDNDEK